MTEDNYWVDAKGSLSKGLGPSGRLPRQQNRVERANTKPDVPDRSQSETFSISLPPELLIRPADRPIAVELTDEQIDDRAFYDARTGVFNFRYFIRVLSNEYVRAKTFEHPFSIAVVSIDNFLEIAINFGHLALDQVVATVTKTLLECTREVDVIATYGEQRFIILCPETPLEQMADFAAQICGRCQLTLPYQWTQVQVTTSIGIACTSYESDLESVIAIADLGADLVTAEGGNDFCYAPFAESSE